MQLKEYLQELYEYNYWANKRYLAVAESLTEEQLFRKQGHSWDSVHAVLVHMMSSERMWPQRWRGEKGSFLDPKDFSTVASIREYWVEVERNMRDFIAEQTEESLQRSVTYTNPKGEHDDFLKCVRSRKDPYFPVEIGHRVSTVCHLANIAIKTGRKLRWSPKRERFVRDDEANRMLDRPRCDPWQLPKV